MISAWREDLWFVCFGAWAFFVIAGAVAGAICGGDLLRDYLRNLFKRK